jgi:hypothetical protein
MEVEQRYIIRFLSDEDMPPLDIVQRLREHSEEEALSQSQVYSRISQVKLWQTDHGNIVSAGRSPDESFATIIANKIENDPHVDSKASILDTSLAFRHPQRVII